LSYQQYLAFLPGLMRGLAISANYTWTGSEAADLPGRTGCAAEGLPTFLCSRPDLQRQASNLYNITPTYTRGRLFVSVGMTYNGSSIYQYAYTTAGDPSYLGPKGPAGDVYFYPHFQLDAQASFKMPRGFTFQLAGLNLTNEVFGFYMGSPQYVLQREYYGPTIQVGLRWSPPREKK
jgi:outer membrane receptor protein involved in Fe transport